MDVAHDTAADEDVLDRAQVRVAQLLGHGDVFQLDVEVLVDRLERTRDLDVVLELDGDGVVDERLEEADTAQERKVELVSNTLEVM